MHTAEIVLALLVLATLVAVFADRLRLPAPSLLVLAGLAVGLLPGVPDVHIAPDLVSLVVLPPLLYAAAVDVVITDLRAVLRPVLVLALGLVAATAVAVALVVHAITPSVSLQVALVLGAVLASTDPVAVSALARRLQLPPRLLALVQGESLLNDATSLLLFRVVVSGVVAGHLAGPVEFPLRFLALGGGGAAIGIACGFIVRQLHQRTDDTVVAAVISLLTPYAVFVAAELAHTSGVTAVVFGGLYLGRRRFQMSRGPARLQIAHLYGVVVFLLESAVFAVIGLQLPTLVRHLTSSEREFVLVALAVTATMLVVRVAWVWAVTYLPGVTLEQPRPRVVAVSSWAGTRGVVPLAAALSIPLTAHAGAAFPHRALLLVLATTCTALTLVVQGLTLGPVVSRTGVVDDPAVRSREQALARHAALAAAMSRLDELREREEASPAAVDWLRREFADRLDRAAELLSAADVSGSPQATREEMRTLRRELIAVQSARLHELVDTGRISEPVRRHVQRLLDLDEARSAD
ncbi:MAG TPA: Na+/H+ antiporter [Mycobacteriales bacterium]|nr:Na+/H+ antiporter [Mycobacteriales bacterium]